MKTWRDVIYWVIVQVLVIFVLAVLCDRVGADKLPQAPRLPQAPAMPCLSTGCCQGDCECNASPSRMCARSKCACVASTTDDKAPATLLVYTDGPCDVYLDSKFVGKTKYDHHHYGPCLILKSEPFSPSVTHKYTVRTAEDIRVVEIKGGGSVMVQLRGGGLLARPYVQPYQGGAPARGATFRSGGC